MGPLRQVEVPAHASSRRAALWRRSVTRDSAAQAYTSFLQLWDQADPEYQGRIKEARAALQELSRERP